LEPGETGFMISADGRLVKLTPGQIIESRYEYGPGRALQVMEKVQAAEGVADTGDEEIDDPGE
jgi:hypothetical protein